MSKENYEIQKQEVSKILNRLVADTKSSVPEKVLINAALLNLMQLLRYEHKAGIKAGLDYYLEEEATIDEMWQRKNKLASELS